jgi:hypothetical protein
MEIILSKTGIYMAYPTTVVLKSIYRPKNYKTMVNKEHTKVGIAKDSFKARSRGYYSNFDNEVIFTPLAVIQDIQTLINVEKFILSEINSEYSRVGHAREWFNTYNHNRIKDIVAQSLTASGVPHEFLG